jgi:hypothetical protein
MLELYKKIIELSYNKKMEDEMSNIKNSLKKVSIKEAQPNFKPYLSAEQEDNMRVQFFDAGAQKWYSIISTLTFQTNFIKLNKETAEELIKVYLTYKSEQSLDWFKISEHPLILELSENITKTMLQNNWDKSFVKLSTRSGKDSPVLMQLALKEFTEVYSKEFLSTKSFEEKIILFYNCRQRAMAVKNGEEAIPILITSERIYEDLLYALEKNFEASDMHIIIREWKCEIPLESEFRGIVWNGNLNTLGQYYYLFHFTNLQGEEEKIKKGIENFYQEKLKPYLPNTLINCVIDFAYLNEDNIKVIEINPFDGYALCSFPESTGLFSLKSEKDNDTIKNGPLEIRIVKEPSKENELKRKIDRNWITVLKNYI